jgi:tetratricopeptide (TPR) repeat protein
MDEFRNFKATLNKQAQYQLDYCKGLYLQAMGNYDEAIAVFERLNQVHQFSWNYYQIAISKNLQNKTDEALKFLGTTFQLEPGLKNDAKQLPILQNLWTNAAFIEMTK